MFRNVGKKIRKLAAVIPIISLCVGVIATLCCFSMTWEAGVIALAISLVGIIFTYIGSLPLYGFGQLVEDTHVIREKIADEILEFR